MASAFDIGEESDEECFEESQEGSSGFMEKIKLLELELEITKLKAVMNESIKDKPEQPRRIISDRGTAFSSNAFKKLMDELKVKHVQVAVACPKANGQVERYNRTLIPLISKLCHEDGVEWDKGIKRAEYLLNNTVNQATKQTPSIALFGVKQREECQNAIETIQEMTGNTEARNCDDRWKEMNENIMKQQSYNEKYYNEKVKRKKVKLKDGDLVLVRARKTVGEPNKLMRKFKGPYLVTKVLDMDRYVIEDVPNHQVSNRPFAGVFDIENLKKYPVETELATGEDESQYDDEANGSMGDNGNVDVWFEDWDPESDSSMCLEEGYEWELNGDE